MTDRRDRNNAIGIDLGTRNALCACFHEGTPVVIPNRWGGTSMPSVVGWDGRWLVGDDAARLALTGSETVWWDLKRKVGTDFSAQCGRERHTAQSLLVPLLSALREDAEAFLDDFVSSCALAVPACFSLCQREAMVRAAESAGLRETRIVNEPTAAALAFGREGRFLVLDFGAGTVDISVVESEKGVWQVLESEGSAGLGGYDFDVALAEWLRERLLIDPLPSADPRWRTLLREAEAIKIALSGCRSHSWTPPPLDGRKYPPLQVEREELERLVRFSIRRLTHTVEKLWDQYAPERLLLVGGSSRIPLLRDILEREVARPERLCLCAGESVVLGAALYGQGGAERLLLDVSSGDVGLVWENQYRLLIPAGTPLPFHTTARILPENSGTTELRLLQDFNAFKKRVQLAFVEFEAVSGREIALDCGLESPGLLRVRVTHDGATFDMPLHAFPQTVNTLAASKEKRQLDRLKLRLTPLELLLESAQQERLHRLMRTVEDFHDAELLDLAKKLVGDLEGALS